MSAADFRPGQRVSIVCYGELRYGTVIRVGRSIVFINLDGSPRVQFCFPESLTPVKGGER